ncbi:MAG: NAD(P)-dependent oxidoreductase [Promethearchaeota archaeon]
MKAFITAEFPKEALEKLKALLADDVIYESWRSTKTLYFEEEKLVSKIKEVGAEIFICEGDNVKKGVIEKVNLRIIGSTRDDPNNIDLESATRKKIPVINAPKRNTISVAELTITLMLALARKIHVIDRTLRSGNFSIDDFKDYVSYYNKFKGIDLSGKTVGIVGLGSIGFNVARRLINFGVKILVHDPYAPESRFNLVNARRVNLERLMAESDFITIHCPPTDETDGLIDASMIALMKKTAFFINLARASIVDEAALHDALLENRIAGAALDVFSEEPVDADNKFIHLDNVIVTPHVGGNTQDTNFRHAMMMVEAIEKLLKGEIPANLLNPEVLGFKTRKKEKNLASVKILELQQKIVETCKKMINKEYVIGSAGNVSARMTARENKDLFLITPSSVDYNNMKPDDIVLIDEKGNVIQGHRNPSSEFRMHVAIYKARPDINAIIHTHAPYSTALSIARIPIGAVVDEFIPFVGGCNITEFAMAGTKELAANCVKALGDNYAALIANHGNVCCGGNLDQAWNNCQMVEHAAKVQHLASMFGTIYGIPIDVEESEKDIFDIIKSSSNLEE